MEYEKKLTSFDELFDIDTKLYGETCACDLMHFRLSTRIMFGFVVIIGPDVIERLHVYFLPNEVYDNFTEGEKDYFKRHFEC